MNTIAEIKEQYYKDQDRAFKEFDAERTKANKENRKEDYSKCFVLDYEHYSNKLFEWMRSEGLNEAQARHLSGFIYNEYHSYFTDCIDKTQELTDLYMQMRSLI